MKLRRTLFISAGVIAISGVYAVGIFPTQALLSQYHVLANDSHQLTNLNKRNAALVNRITQLNRPSVVAEIARRDYGMYPSSSIPYQVLPSSPLNQAPPTGR
ncbi:MAG: FtsB family cell division protein [Ferrimicrobium sp.]